MTQMIRAIFENGVLRPLEPLNIRENEEVQVVVAFSDAVRGTGTDQAFPVFDAPEAARPITLETVCQALEDVP